jgi:hypothetical protein
LLAMLLSFSSVGSGVCLLRRLRSEKPIVVRASGC